MLVLLNCTITPIFESSPWIIITNKTPFHFSSQIKITSDISNLKSQTISLPVCEKNISIQYEKHKNESGNNIIVYTINIIDCAPQQTIYLDQACFINGKSKNLEIQFVSFTHNSLQLTVYAVPKTIHDHYFSIHYDADTGITASTEKIPFYTKYLYHTQQMICHAIIAASNFIGWKYL